MQTLHIYIARNACAIYGPLCVSTRGRDLLIPDAYLELVKSAENLPKQEIMHESERAGRRTWTNGYGPTGLMSGLKKAGDT